jgi:hypothetical protein
VDATKLTVKALLCFSGEEEDFRNSTMEEVIGRTQCNGKLTARTFLWFIASCRFFFFFFVFIFLDFVYSFDPLCLRTCSCSSLLKCFDMK